MSKETGVPVETLGYYDENGLMLQSSRGSTLFTRI